MPETILQVIDRFYGGIVRDEKSRVIGAALNIEELDILENQDFVRPSQIFSADSMPASTEIYAYTADDDDVMYGYGKETSGNEVRLVSVASGGADNPGSFSTLFTGSSGEAAKIYSDFKWFKTSETAGGYLYYITGTDSLRRYDITGAAEEDVGTLSGLTGSFDRVVMKVIFGELFICHGQFIAKVDSDGVFTEKAFTMPNEWHAVDIIPVSDIGLILARNVVRNANFCKGFWWDLTRSTQFDDSFNIPMGGPQWIINHKEDLRIFCAINGIGKFFQMSAAAPGAKPIQLPGIELSNIAAEESTVPISHPKGVSTKDDILFFNLYKTDKTGMYAMGQLDSIRPNAVYLAKRFHTSDYANHKPTALHIQGPNFYAAFDDNGTASNSRCESNNSPTRSSNAVYESVVLDEGNPAKDKSMDMLALVTKPLPASCQIAVSVNQDYGSYDAITRPDGSDFDTDNELLGFYNKTGISKAKTMQIKLAFTSNGTDAPILTAIIYQVTRQQTIAYG